MNSHFKKKKQTEKYLLSNVARRYHLLAIHNTLRLIINNFTISLSFPCAFIFFECIISEMFATKMRLLFQMRLQTCGNGQRKAHTFSMVIRRCHSIFPCRSMLFQHPSCRHGFCPYSPRSAPAALLLVESFSEICGKCG